MKWRQYSAVDGFADGVAVRQVGETCFDLCQQLVDGVMTVSTTQICAAIKDVFEETRCILEPAGAVGVAGAKAGRCTVNGSILCGKQLELSVYSRITMKCLKVLLPSSSCGTTARRTAQRTA